MATETAQIIFKFVEQGQGTIDNVAKRVEGVSKAVADVGQVGTRAGSTLNSAFSNFGSTIESAVTRPLEFGKAKFADWLSTLGTGGAVIGGLTASLFALGGASLALVKQQGEAAEQVTILAARLGLSVSQAEQFAAAAKIAGSDVSVLEQSSIALAQALDDTTGGSDKVRTALRQLGIETQAASGADRERGQILLEVFAALSKVEDGNKRAALSGDLLGRGAKTVQSLVADYGALQAAVKRLGIGLDESLTTNLAAADDEIDKLTLSFQQLLKQFAAKVAPVVVPVVVKLTEVISSTGGGARPAGVGPGALTSLDAARGSLDQLDLSSLLRGRLSPSSADATGLIESNLARGRDLAGGFSEARKRTIDGFQARLKAAQKESLDLERSLSAGGLSADSFALRKATFDALQREIKTLEASIKAAEERKALVAKLSDLIAESSKAPLTPIARINVDQAELAAKLGPGFERQIAQVFAPRRAAERQKILHDARASLKDVAERGTREAEQRVEELLGYSKEQFQRALQTRAEEDEKQFRIAQGQFDVATASDISRVTRRTSAANRLDGLLTPAGRERDAVERAYQRDIAAAQAIYDIAERAAKLKKDEVELLHARAQLEESIDQARLDRQIQIAELQKRSLEDYKRTAGQVYQTLRREGSGGLRSLLIGQLDIQGQKIFENISGSIFQRAGSTLGRVGARLGIPQELLAGTLLDPANAQVDRQVTSMDRLTGSVDRLNATIATGSTTVSPGNAAVATAAALAPSGSRSPLVAGLGSILSAGLFAGLRGGDRSIQTADGRATTSAALGLTTTAGRLSNVLGSTAILGGAAYGAVSGFGRGGVGGVSQGISSILGAASLIPGPQQPFLQAGALVAGFVSTLFGDRDAARRRAEETAETLNRRRYVDAEGRTYNTDLGGSVDVDSDFRGRVRVIVHRPVQVTINALDARSIEERGADLATAIAQQVEDGHPIGPTINRLVLGEV